MNALNVGIIKLIMKRIQITLLLTISYRWLVSIGNITTYCCFNNSMYNHS